MAAGAAALILGRSGADPDADPALRRLASALDADIVAQVDGWSADGPDGEQILCLTDLLHRRALEDDTFRRWMTLAAAPPKAVPALRALAERCREQDHRGAAGWCEERIAELTRVPRVVDLRQVDDVPAADLHADRHVTTWLAGLQPGLVAGSDATGDLDEDAALDLVSGLLHAAEDGDAALAAWESAASVLIDRAMPA